MEQLEKENFIKLTLNHAANQYVLVVGCGLGGTMRTGSKRYQEEQFLGIYFMSEYVNFGNKINKTRGLDSNVRIVEGNYLNLPVEDCTVNGAYMLSKDLFRATKESEQKSGNNACKYSYL